MLAGPLADRAARFRLVHLAVAHERPHLATCVDTIWRSCRYFMTAHGRWPIGPSPIDTVGNCQKSASPRVRIGRDALAVDFLAEVVDCSAVSRPSMNARA